MSKTITQTTTFDSVVPPMVTAATVSLGKCFFCGREIFTSFVRFPVAVTARRRYIAKAHTGCYPRGGDQ